MQAPIVVGEKVVKVESNGVGLFTVIRALSHVYTHTVTERHGGRGKGMKEREQILFQVFCLGGGGAGLIDGLDFSFVLFF